MGQQGMQQQWSGREYWLLLFCTAAHAPCCDHHHSPVGSREATAASQQSAPCRICIRIVILRRTCSRGQRLPTPQLASTSQRGLTATSSACSPGRRGSWVAHRTLAVPACLCLQAGSGSWPGHRSSGGPWLLHLQLGHQQWPPLPSLPC